MRNSMDPYGGINPLIDKMIGNAYDIVKYVARYLKEIRYLAENMQYVYAAANGNRTVVEATAAGALLAIPLPVGITPSMVLGMYVTATTPLDGAVYFPDQFTFNFGIIEDEVRISITDVDLQTANFKITFTTAAE